MPSWPPPLAWVDRGNVGNTMKVGEGRKAAYKKPGGVRVWFGCQCEVGSRTVPDEDFGNGYVETSVLHRTRLLFYYCPDIDSLTLEPIHYLK